VPICQHVATNIEALAYRDTNITVHVNACSHKSYRSPFSRLHYAVPRVEPRHPTCKNHLPSFTSTIPCSRAHIASVTSSILPVTELIPRVRGLIPAVTSQAPPSLR
jgi:hypothetical protein